MAIMDLRILMAMAEAALVTLEETEIMEVVNRIMESRAARMLGMAAMKAIIMEEVHALGMVVEALLEVAKVTLTLAITKNKSIFQWQKVLIVTKQSLVVEEIQRRDMEVIGYNKFVNLAKYSGARP